VPTVNKAVPNVVVPMPTPPDPVPESTYSNGTLVFVEVPIAISPQTSSLYLGEVVAMPTLPVLNIVKYLEVKSPLAMSNLFVVPSSTIAKSNVPAVENLMPELKALLNLSIKRYE